MLGHALRENVAKARAAALAFMELVGKQSLLRTTPSYRSGGEARADLRALVKQRFAVGKRFSNRNTRRATPTFPQKAQCGGEEQGGQRIKSRIYSPPFFIFHFRPL